MVASFRSLLQEECGVEEAVMQIAFENGLTDEEAETHLEEVLGDIYLYAVQYKPD
jgi:hypothetical protein